MHLKTTSIPISLFKEKITLQELNKMAKNTLAEQLGMEFTVLGDDFVTATMPVDRRTRQPLGLLHGGASVALAETVGSVAAALCVDSKTHYCVGIEINANHVKSVKTGIVLGTARPIHIGKKTHVWEIRITQKQLISISRITIAVLERQ